jgi:AcrR family transcriptional regulator
MAPRTKAKKPARKSAAQRSGVQLGELSARAMILQGAARLFAEHGIRKPSVEHLLEAAGVSRRTFYRLYASKEDVVAALYRLGTSRLIDGVTLAMSEESDTGRRMERCIEAHLQTAREYGRLVFVLGGEAQGHESPLYARRMEVHHALVSLFSGRAGAQSSVDPLFYRGLIIAIEGVTRVMLAECDDGKNVTEASIERARRVMRRIVSGAVEAKGEGVAPMPLLKSR